MVADAVADTVGCVVSACRRSLASSARIAPRGWRRPHPMRRPRMRVVVAPTCVDGRRAMPRGLRNFAQSGLCGAEKRPLDEKKEGCRSPPFHRVPGCPRRLRRRRRRRADVSRVKHETAEKKMF
jgi:hypothetical protein